MIKDLNEKCEAHNLGVGSDKVQIREGIFESSVAKDMERQGPPKIPANFNLSGV